MGSSLVAEAWVAWLLHHKVLAVSVQLPELRQRCLVGFLFVHIFGDCREALLLELRRTLIGLSRESLSRGPAKNMWVLFLQLLKHFGAVLRLH